VSTVQLTSLAAQGARWTTISAGSAALIQVLRLVILARLLSPADFGLMAMTMIVIDICQTYIDLGISAAIIHRQDATREQLSSLYWLNVFAGWAMFVVVWLGMPLIAMMFHEPRVLPLLRVIALIFIIAPFGQQFEILLQRDLKFDALAKQEIIASGCGFVVAAALAASGFGVWALAWGVLANIGTKTMLLVRVGMLRFRPSIHFRCSDLNGFLSFGLFQMGERAVNYLSERLDQLLIGSLLGVNALGYYTFAFNLTAQPITRINPIITRVAFPVFSKVQHDVERLRRGYLRVLSLLTTVNAPLLVGLAALAPLAVPLIFGKKWMASVALVQFLSLVSLTRSTCNPIGSLQLAKGRADLGFHWNVFLLIVSVPTIYWGGRVAQAIGVAVGLLILQMALLVPVYVFLVRPLIGECAKQYASGILKPTAAAVLMAAIVVFCRNLYHGFPPVAELIALVSVGAGLYVLFLQLLDRTTLYEFRSILFRTAS
jgi:lipopolysaccharide exporter